MIWSQLPLWQVRLVNRLAGAAVTTVLLAEPGVTPDVTPLLRKLRRRGCCCCIKEIGGVLALLWPQLPPRQKALTRLAFSQIHSQQQPLLHSQPWRHESSCKQCRPRSGPIRYHEKDELGIRLDMLLASDRESRKPAVLSFLEYVKQQRFRERSGIPRLWSHLRSWYKLLRQDDPDVWHHCQQQFGMYFERD